MAKTPQEYWDLLHQTDPETGLPLDEGNLSEQDIQGRIEAYNELQKSGRPIDQGSLSFI